MKSKRIQRVLSLVMALCLVLGLLPTAAFADGVFSNNVGKYLWYSSQGTPASSPALDESKKEAENGDLVFSKDIEQKTEDTFDITLKVTTTENLKEIPLSQDAAVALVLDVSNSMEACALCGEHRGTGYGVNGVYVHAKGCQYYNSNKDHKVLQGEKRIAAAKKAAAQFVDDFAKDANGAKRMVAVVAYGSDAYIKTTWADVATPVGLNQVKAAIDDTNISLKTDDGATCTDAGLQLAYNLYGADAVQNIASRFTVLLSDGQPNRYKSGTGDMEKVPGNADSKNNSTESASKAAETAKALKDDKKVTLYTLAFATANEDCYEGWVDIVTTCNIEGWHQHSEGDGYGNGKRGKMDGGKFVKCPWYHLNIGFGWCGCQKYWFNGTHYKTKSEYKQVTVGEWMESIATFGCYKNATDGDQLSISFAQIAETIRRLLAAWKVTDPMGDYIQLTDESIAALDRKNQTVTLTKDTMGKTTGFIWNLWEEQPVVTSQGSGSDQINFYNYTLTYGVKLDTTAQGFEDGKYYPTNKATKLEYIVDALDEQGHLRPDAETSVDYFNVPTVKGKAPVVGYTIEYYKLNYVTGQYEKQEDDTKTDTARLWATVTPDNGFETQYGDNWTFNADRTGVAEGETVSMTIGQGENVLKLYYDPIVFEGKVQHFYRENKIDVNGNTQDGTYDLGLTGNLAAPKEDPSAEIELSCTTGGLKYELDTVVKVASDGTETEITANTDNKYMVELVADGDENQYKVYYTYVQDDRNPASVTVTKTYIQQKWQLNETTGKWEIVDGQSTKINDERTGLKATYTFIVPFGPGEDYEGYAYETNSLRGSNNPVINGDNVEMKLAEGENTIELTYKKAPTETPDKVAVVVNHHYRWNVTELDNGAPKSDTGSVDGSNKIDNVFVGTRLSAIVSEEKKDGQHGWEYNSADSNATELAKTVGAGENGVFTIDLYYDYAQAPQPATVTVNHVYLTKTVHEESQFDGDGNAIGTTSVTKLTQTTKVTEQYPKDNDKLYAGQVWTASTIPQNDFTFVESISDDEGHVYNSDETYLKLADGGNVLTLYYVKDGGKKDDTEKASVTYQYHYTTVRYYIDAEGNEQAESSTVDLNAVMVTDQTVGAPFTVPEAPDYKGNTYTLDPQKPVGMTITVQKSNDVIHVYYTRNQEDRGAQIPYEVHYIYKTLVNQLVAQPDGSVKAEYVEDVAARFEDESLLMKGSCYAGQYFTIQESGQKNEFPEKLGGPVKDQTFMVAANAENKYEIVWAKRVNDLTSVNYVVKHHYTTIDEQGTSTTNVVTPETKNLYAGETLTVNAEPTNEGSAFTFQYYTVNGGKNKIEENSYSAPLNETVTLDFYYEQDNSKIVKYSVIHEYYDKDWDEDNYKLVHSVPNPENATAKAGKSFTANPSTMDGKYAVSDVVFKVGDQEVNGVIDGQNYTMKLVADGDKVNTITIKYIRNTDTRKETTVTVNHRYSVRNTSTGATTDEGVETEKFTSYKDGKLDFNGTGVYVGAEFTAKTILKHTFNDTERDYTRITEEKDCTITLTESDNVIDIYYERTVSNIPGGNRPGPIPTDPTPTPSSDPTETPSNTPSAEPSETPEEIELPEEETPLAELPEEELPELELPDEEIPLAELPEEELEIPDEEVPLSGEPMLPQTGMNWLPAILLAVGGVSASATGLFLSRKKEEEEI